MTIFKSFRDLDKKFSWSFLGFLLAIVFGTITIYDRFIADKTPQLYLDILANTAVLDIKEDVAALDILFGGINIKQQSLSLRIMTIKIVNDSSRDILRTLYDPDDPVGFRLSSGQIIRADIMQSSNDYLTRNLSLQVSTNASVHFRDVIFEAQQYSIVKLLVLHPSHQPPDIIPLGHIAGMKTILVRPIYKQSGIPSFWSRTVSGTWDVQLTRMLVYLFCVMLAIAFIAAPTIVISSTLEGMKKKRIVKEFKAATHVPLNESDEYIFTQYVSMDSGTILSMQQLVGTQKSVDAAFRAYRRMTRDKTSAQLHEEMIAYAGRPYFRPNYTAYLLGDMIKAGVVHVEHNHATIDPHMKTTLEHFARFLQSKGQVSEFDKTMATGRMLDSENVRELMQQYGVETEQDPPNGPRDDQVSRQDDK